MIMMENTVRKNTAERGIPQAKRCGRFPPDASRGQPRRPAQPRPKINNAATARGGEMVGYDDDNSGKMMVELL